MTQRDGVSHVALRGDDCVRVGVSRNKYVHVHLPRDGAERVEVAGRDALVPMRYANSDGGVRYSCREG